MREAGEVRAKDGKDIRDSKAFRTLALLSLVALVSLLCAAPLRAVGPSLQSEGGFVVLTGLPSLLQRADLRKQLDSGLTATLAFEVKTTGASPEKLGERGPGGVRFAAPQLGHGEVETGLVVVRIDLQRLPEQSRRTVEVGGLDGEHAHAIDRTGIAGRHHCRRPVRGGGLVRTAQGA